jgi:hypothetical protein
MLAGCDTLTDIIAWISHAPRGELQALGWRAAPCGRTVTRILALVSPPGTVPGRRRLARQGRGRRARSPSPSPGRPCSRRSPATAMKSAVPSAPDGTNLFLLSAALTGTARRAASGAIVLADREIPASRTEDAMS